MDKTIVVIPARYNSQRFPGKVLYPLMGKPVLQWVYESAVKSKITNEVIITTEDERVMNFARSIGAKAIKTSESCKSGSDRVWEVARKIKCEFVVNLQSDEPFITSEVIRGALKKLKENKNYHIATACSPIYNKKEIKNINCVKIVINKEGKAFYFSRSPVPYHHKLSIFSGKIPYYKHCGFYIYRKKALSRFVKLPFSEIEELERLEQLRALENGFNIVAVKVEKLGPAIDVISDIRKAVKYIKEMGERS